MGERRSIGRFFIPSKVIGLLRTQDLLIISGGGQLDEEYGGAWRLPFAICKWVLLARLARVPCAMASVGAGMITFAGFAQVHLDGASYVLIQVLSGNEK